MVTVNANVDLRTHQILDTESLNQNLFDLSNSDIGITFVARDNTFFKEAWRVGKKTYMRVILPYEEVLSTSNVDLLAMHYLFEHLDLLNWVDPIELEEMKFKLKKKIEELR